MQVEFAAPLGPDHFNNDPNAMEPAFVLFLNTTSRYVNVYWVDFHGRHVLYGNLRPQDRVKVNTFHTHTWIFCDHFTGERLQINHQDTFHAEPAMMKNPADGNIVPCRKLVFIHFPLRTLRENCLWKSLYVLLRNGQQKRSSLHKTANMIERLCLPRSIKTDLKQVLRQFEVFRKNRPDSS